MSETPVKLGIIYAFARSGGTLLNRCLGSIPGNIVLSEVNPRASVALLEQQAQDWFHLLSSEELSQFSEKSYGEKVLYLAERAHQQGKHLIIRDWPSVNFLRNASGVIYSPSMVLEQELYLMRHSKKLEIRRITFSRRSTDVYESLTRVFAHLKYQSISEFGKSYLEYARAAYEFPLFHYEAFCQQPQETLKEICEALAVSYDSQFLHNFNQFTRCTGDNTSTTTASRGTTLSEIARLESRQEAIAYTLASLDSNCRQADRLFGYKDMEESTHPQDNSMLEQLWKVLDERDQAIARLQLEFEQVRQRLSEKTSALEQELYVSRAATTREEQQLREENQALLVQQALDRQIHQTQLQQAQSQAQQIEAQLREVKCKLEQSQLEQQQTEAKLHQSEINLQQTKLERQQTRTKLQQAKQRLNQAKDSLNQRQSALKRIRSELKRSRTRIAAMESSKFWKLRSRWVKVKHKLGLTSPDE